MLQAVAWATTTVIRFKEQGSGSNQVTQFETRQDAFALYIDRSNIYPQPLKYSQEETAKDANCPIYTGRY